MFLSTVFLLKFLVLFFYCYRLVFFFVKVFVVTVLVVTCLFVTVFVVTVFVVFAAHWSLVQLIFSLFKAFVFHNKYQQYYYIGFSIILAYVGFPVRNGPEGFDLL